MKCTDCFECGIRLFIGQEIYSYNNEVFCSYSCVFSFVEPFVWKRALLEVECKEEIEKGDAE